MALSIPAVLIPLKIEDALSRAKPKPINVPNSPIIRIIPGATSAQRSAGVETVWLISSIELCSGSNFAVVSSSSNQFFCQFSGRACK